MPEYSITSTPLSEYTEMSETAFTKLLEYISTKMRMSHIYQPVMIREILVRGGEANVEEIAKATIGVAMLLDI